VISSSVPRVALRDHRYRPPSGGAAGPADRRRQGYGGPPTTFAEGSGGPPQLQRRRKLHAKAEAGHYRFC